MMSPRARATVGASRRSPRAARRVPSRSAAGVGIRWRLSSRAALAGPRFCLGVCPEQREQRAVVGDVQEGPPAGVAGLDPHPAGHAGTSTLPSG